jgi:hypothetical protein
MLFGGPFSAPVVTTSGYDTLPFRPAPEQAAHELASGQLAPYVVLRMDEGADSLRRLVGDGAVIARTPSAGELEALEKGLDVMGVPRRLPMPGGIAQVPADRLQDCPAVRSSASHGSLSVPRRLPALRPPRQFRRPVILDSQGWLVAVLDRHRQAWSRARSRAAPHASSGDGLTVTP